MTYKEQLLDKRWKEKRLHILRRDNFTCQNCNNDTIKSISKSAQITNFYCLDNQALAIFNADDPRFRPNNPKYLVLFIEDLKSVEASVYMNHWLTHREIDIIKSSLVYYIDRVDLKHDYLNTAVDEKLVTIIIGSNGDTLFIRDLHVHHNYYQEGKMAWEYDKDALVTLCWSCHEEIHKNCIIPIKDYYGVESGYKTCCDRCLGAGFIPKYNHVQGGVCFKCKGERFL